MQLNFAFFPLSFYDVNFFHASWWFVFVLLAPNKSEMDDPEPSVHFDDWYSIHFSSVELHLLTTLFTKFYFVILQINLNNQAAVTLGTL